MKDEEKVKLIQIALLIQKELPNYKNTTEDDKFLLDTSNQVLNAISELSEAFLKALNNFTTDNVKKILENKPQSSSQNTEIIDAAIGTGLYISNEIVHQNMVEAALEQQQVHEFNNMMASVSDF